MHTLKAFSKSGMVLVAMLLAFASCKDTYYYDDREPEWLGSSIYDYLKEDGNFNYFVSIIDTCHYTEVLAKTGSKTMFVCPDSVFESFFKSNNEWGVKRFSDFTATQLKQIMEYSMVNDANLIELLSYDYDYVKGQILRRTTSLDPLDLLEHEYVGQPEEKVFSKYFQPYIGKGIYTLNDNTSPRLVQFFQAQMSEQNITNEDFSIIFNGQQRQTDDAHLFGNKVIERDITCKNGYIHVLNGLMLPEPNMAQYIRENKDLTAFNALLDRYSAPYYNSSQTTTYRELHPDFPLGDSIFDRRYIANLSAAGQVLKTPDGLDVSDDERLLYDPGWNGYDYKGSDKYDMGAMFVPDNQAIHDYFYLEDASGKNIADGNFLWERYWDSYHHGEPQPSVDEAYHYWDSVPNDIATMFVNAHMQYSFIKSLPSRFDGLTNEDGDDMFMDKNDVRRVKVGSNGAVYVTDDVYPPVDYVSVMAPVLVGEHTKVFNYAIKNMSFRYYLRSMEAAYHPDVVAPFTFIVPYDENLDNFIYPAAQGHKVHEMLKFGYNETFQTVYATRYRYDENTGEKTSLYSETTGDPLNGLNPIITQTTGDIHSVVKTYLKEIMDYHVIVDSIYPGQEYYESKGKGFIRVKFADPSKPETAQFYGGGNMEQNKKWGATKQWDDEKYRVNTLDRKEFRNGVTYIVDKMLQKPLSSVYSTLAANSELNTFFKALREVPDADYEFFSNVSKYPGITMNIGFFKGYHYTIYALNNQAMEQARQDGLPTWSQVQTLLASKKREERTKGEYMMQKIVSFLRYHFQDNSIYIKGYYVNNKRCETAVKNDRTGKFISVWATQDGSNIQIVPTVVSATGVETHNYAEQVNVTTDGLYNLMARDHFFYQANSDATKAVGTISDYSARTVIHELTHYLHYIKAPETVLNNYEFKKATSSVNISMDVTDNGDGVVFDGGVITRRGLCWSYSPTPTIYDNVIDVETTSDVLVGQTVSITDNSGKPVYIRSFAVSKYDDSGKVAADPSKAMVSYSDNEYCLNITEGKTAE